MLIPKGSHNSECTQTDQWASTVVESYPGNMFLSGYFEFFLLLFLLSIIIKHIL
jgi:hypothetical protein